MADQLVLIINRAADEYHWCWLDAQLNPRLETAGSGPVEALAAAVHGNYHQVWLIVPGTKVVTREVEYSDKEKKHLRTLLPFQLEETVIGDVERFHFALGSLANGVARVAYVEKAWFEQVFAQLAAINLDVTRCWSAPAALPLLPPVETSADADTEVDAPALKEDFWTLQLYEQVVMVRYAPELAFSVERAHLATALDLLLIAERRVDHLPGLLLRATSAQDLERLADSLPPSLQGRVVAQQQVNIWQLDYTGRSINLCQGEFSQRLPIERWWGSWRGVALLAAACLAVHIGILLYQIQDFRAENTEIRRQIETAFRQAVPQGVLIDAERQLAGLVREAQPLAQGGSLTLLLANVLPPLAENSAITLRNIQYLGDNGELNIQLQASEYDAIENLRSRIEANGLSAELLGSSAQGNTHSARLKISQRR